MELKPGTVVAVFGQKVAYQTEPLKNQFGMVVRVIGQNAEVEVDSSVITKPIKSLIPVVQATPAEVVAKLPTNEIVSRHMADILLVLFSTLREINETLIEHVYPEHE